MERVEGLKGAQNVLSGKTSGLFSFSIPIILLSIIVYYFQVDFTQLQAQFLSFSIFWVFLSVATFFSLNFLLVSFRLLLAYKQLGYALSYPIALQATFFGQIGGVVPVFGTLFGQGLHLYKKLAIPSSISTSVMLYERILVATTGLLLSTTGAFLLFREKIMLIFAEASVLKLLVSLGVTLVAVLCIGLTPSDQDKMKRLFSIRNLYYTGYLLVVAIGGWLLSALSFAMLFSILKIDISFGLALSASVIVCFIASLPISANGWGVREFAAMSIFGLCAVPKEAAIFSAVCIGFFSYVALMAWGAILSFCSQQNEGVYRKSRLRISLTRLEGNTIYFLACAASVLVFFQIHVKCGDAVLNVNAADPIALCGFVMAVISNLLRKRSLKYHLPSTLRFLVSAVMVFFVAALVGVVKTGVNHYSILYKLFGFFVLLGYANIGAELVSRFGQKGYEAAVRLMMTTIIVSIALGSVISILAKAGVIPLSYLQESFVGLSGNRNALALQILLITFLFFSGVFKNIRLPSGCRYLLSSILLYGLYLTFSRSALITGAILLFIFWRMAWLKTWEIIGFLTGATACVLGIHLVDFLLSIAKFNLFLNEGFIASSEQVSIFSQYSNSFSDHERWYSLMEGMRLWFNEPLLGGGLASFSYHEILKNGRPLVIHNTLIWLIAEFGLVGALPFLWYGFKTLVYLGTKISSQNVSCMDVKDKALFSLIFILIMMGMAHEVFYQRILWLAWGMLVVVPVGSERAIAPEVAEREGFEPSVRY